MSEKIIVEGELYSAGDGYECGWLTLAGRQIEDWLPPLKKFPQQTTTLVRTEYADDTRQHVGEPLRFDCPRWQLPDGTRQVLGGDYEELFGTWGKVRVTIEFLND